MNLIEAIKSGRPFSRAGRKFLPGTGHMDARANLSYAEIVASDWEVEEPQVSITRTQFWDAASRCIDGNGRELARLANMLGLGCDHDYRPVNRTYDECTKCGERQ